jgi:hypothetical protein
VTATKPGEHADFVVGLCRTIGGEMVPRCDVTESIGTCAMPLGPNYGRAEMRAYYVIPATSRAREVSIETMRATDMFAEAQIACRALPGLWHYGIPPELMPQ